MLELKQLTYFRTVARLENVTKAAEELYVSQPNLSASISRLETSLGVKLFERTRGRIYLSEDGKKFLEHVENVFNELETAVDEVKEVQSYRQDKIVLGAGCAGFLSGLYYDYTLDYGTLPSERYILDDEIIIRRTIDGQMDVGIVTQQTHNPALECVEVADLPLAVIMKAENPLAKEKEDASFSMTDLAGAHFICSTLYLSRYHLTDLGRRCGFLPEIVRMSNEREYFDENSFDFGMNVALCPICLLRMIAPHERPDLAVFPLNDRRSQIRVYLIRNRSEEKRTVFGDDFFAYALEKLPRMIAKEEAYGRILLREADDGMTT